MSPALIEAESKARDRGYRVMFGGALLLLMCGAWILAMCLKLDGANQIPPILGTGLGFLLGGEASRSARR